MCARHRLPPHLRFQKDVFYSDVLPPALVTWRAHLKGREWLANANYEVQFESLRPEDMADGELVCKCDLFT
jgi:hypothetical protein